MQRHHGALAEADESEPVARQLQTGELGVDESVQYRGGNTGAARGLLGIDAGERKPLIAGTGDALGCMGRHEGSARKRLLPMRGQANQIIAVRAVAMAEHHKMSGRPLKGRHAWSVEGAHVRSCRWSVAMIVTRFAPSPTGFLHLGHAFAAITAFDAARRQAGLFLLRIEDIDTTRCRREFEQAIFEDLSWLGLSWEEPVRRQSEHFADYSAALSRLDAAGLLYPCFCTRKDIA